MLFYYSYVIDFLNNLLNIEIENIFNKYWLLRKKNRIIKNCVHFYKQCTDLYFVAFCQMNHIFMVKLILYDKYNEQSYIICNLPRYRIITSMYFFKILKSCYNP